MISKVASNPIKNIYRKKNQETCRISATQFYYEESDKDLTLLLRLVNGHVVEINQIKYVLACDDLYMDPLAKTIIYSSL